MKKLYFFLKKHKLLASACPTPVLIMTLKDLADFNKLRIFFLIRPIFILFMSINVVAVRNFEMEATITTAKLRVMKSSDVWIYNIYIRSTILRQGLEQCNKTSQWLFET